VPGLKVAVLGGGTTGFIAAAHLSRYFPQYELLHVYDSSRPVIAVGEGTIPVFRRWLYEVTGCGDEEVIRRCQATVKYGLHFEGWGTRREAFSHWFMPRREARAWHLLGSALIELLAEHCRSTHLDEEVTATRSDGTSVEVTLASGASFTADLVLDARGYPGDAAEAVPLEWIPTNAGRVYRGPAVTGQTLTRAIARPHGWIAVVPLAHQTVYGYIHNESISSVEQLEADLREFCVAEGVGSVEGGGVYRFPNFVSPRIFDGALYALGSRAGFLEPLEATALGMTLLEMMHLSQLILPELHWHRRFGPYDPAFLEAYNRSFFEGMVELSFLIAWYYSEGSRFDSPFWRHARGRLEIPRGDARFESQVRSFEGWRKRAADFPDPHEDFESFRRSWRAEPSGPKLGHLFRAHNLAWIGHGIGGL
jgi:tryptophan halogenase